MSNISDTIYDLNNNKLNPTIDDTKKVLEMLLPRDENNDMLSSYSIKQKNHKSAGAMFIPQYNNLYFSYTAMQKWCERQCEDFINDKYISKENYLELYNYFWFWSLFHETEHCKQFIIALKNYPCECNALPKVYKELFELLMKNSNWQSFIPFYDVIRIIRQIKYKKNENDLLLERNANIFSFEAMIKIMENDSHISEETIQLFNALYVANLLLGYKISDNEIDYPISQTLKTIGKKSKIKELDFSYDIPLIMQMEYGMPIDKNLVQNIFNCSKDNGNDFIKTKKKIHEILK